MPEREHESITTARIGQNNFRLLLLNEYDSTCSMVGIDEPKLLLANHIKAGHYSNYTEKVPSKNEILLSAMFDKLFDQGLIIFYG